ncbi:L-aminopeptidase/D-esterase [Rhizobiales bacterium GAS113]|nr:L-aminopeptidase/D-esterase [Rhizobiales bacterium GAS113]
MVGKIDRARAAALRGSTLRCTMLRPLALTLAVVGAMLATASFAADKERARALGIPFDGTPGPLNAITDIAGVEVGFTTLIQGEGKLEIGKGPVRTGVTAILPRGKVYDPVFAGFYSFNGNGEMTGIHWVKESGFLEGPIMITNTHSVGMVRDATIEWQNKNKLYVPLVRDIYWLMPIVAETYDGTLNDINGFHVKKEDVFAALDSAKPGPVAEGNVGGGTGMSLHRFKGGTGTASRKLPSEKGGYTVGALVQANYGARDALTVAGVPVGKEIPDLMPTINVPGSTGSIVVVIATDAPLLPNQLERLARRAPLGIGRTGGLGSNGDGDLVIAFSTANPGVAKRSGVMDLKMLPNDAIDDFLLATVQATEEAIINALVAAETLKGRDNNVLYSIPHDRLREALRKYNRLQQ